MKKITIRKDAELDINDAYQWYKANEEGLGEECLENITESLKKIKESPKIYPIVHNKSVRRAFINKFPYGVFYLEHEDSITVVAVMHTRRNPASWQQRL